MSTLNLNYYKDEDTSVYFSFRNLPKTVLDLLKNIDNPESYNKLPFEIKYFINPKKANLLNWYEFKPEDDILIINDCLGYITESICDKVKSVSIVEFSKPIAEITNERLSSKENVEIYAGDTLGITFTTNYDYIILIDIMESLNPFYNFKDPYKEFFEYIGYFLKPNGKLIMSANNMLGLKNWAGAIDEKTGKLFSDMGTYTIISDNLYTKFDYDKIFEFLEYDDCMYFYPIPSQYAPEQVVMESELKDSNYSKYFQNYAMYIKKLYNDSNVVDNIIKNNKFYLFANSFLIFAGKKEAGEISW